MYLASIAVLLVASVYSFYAFVNSQADKLYIFSPDSLHSAALASIQQHGNDTRALVDHIVQHLRTDSQVSPYLTTDEEWIFNNAGGAMGIMYIIHASITEYLIIFGTPLGTEGHTGRHTADDYFHILSGTQIAVSPATPFTAEVYPAGSVHHLRRGEAKQYRMESSCFALEYARGWIPGMLLFGFGDGLSSTFDWPTLWRTTFVTGREMINNLLVGKL